MPLATDVSRDYFEREGEDSGDEYRGERLDPNADPDCPYCHGTGYVSDWVPVPFGSGNCEMRTGCECLPDPDDDDNEKPDEDLPEEPEEEEDDDEA
jgi:hypothetical protein